MANNVLGGELADCSHDPLTGWTRNGCCETGPGDMGVHTVCCRVTEEFLAFSVAQGNDLVTPVPEYGFPGLRPGDQWCVCATRWRDAAEAGVGAPVVLAATHIGTLEWVSMDLLMAHAVDAPTSE